MDASIIVAIVGGIEAIGVALIGALVAHANHKADNHAKNAEASERKRVERDACLYDLVFATASACEVLLHQAHGERVNGNVDEALDEIRTAKSECNRIFNRQAANM